MYGFHREYPGKLELNSGTFFVERALATDVPAMVAMLRDDPLGADRELDDLTVYQLAFQAINRDPNQFLAVVRSTSDELAGMMQLTLIPGLSRGAATRLLVESVRIAADFRGSGLGTAMFEWAHGCGRLNGATLAQLTSDKTRDDAHRFYLRLGYVASHEGFKKVLE